MFVIPFFQNRKMFRGNNSNLKKMDTTLYKKVFFGNFKEDCNHLLPPNKNFLNEKYQNFKNIYNKIFFYKRKFKKNCNEIFEESIAKGKKVNELKKINHKNGVIQLLIQKLQNQPIKIKENNYFKDVFIK